MRPVETNVEAGWKTYLKATVFLLPPVIFYYLALVKIVPQLKELWSVAKIDMSEVGWVWHHALFLGQNGRFIFVIMIVALVLLEFLSKRMWARYRRVAVGIMVWILNVYVLLSLGYFLILAVMAAQNLTHPK